VTRRSGSFDWSKISETDIRALSDEMFDAAQVPPDVRQDYWKHFEKMKAALQNRASTQSMEATTVADTLDILTAEQMKERYGSFYVQSPRLSLDRAAVPQRFWPLLAYAEFWGIADDWTRDGLVDDAPADVKQNLKIVVAAFDRDLDEWLAGPEADDPNPSEEYVAFSAMRMAADYA
jgi:hypothetical protein